MGSDKPSHGQLNVKHFSWANTS